MLHSDVLYPCDETTEAIPFLDLYETDEELILEMDLPGIDPEDVLIKVFEDIIIIEGIRRGASEKKGFKYICMERSFGSFRRIVNIPIPVRTVEGKASYNDGVMSLAFPKLNGTL